MKYLLFTYNFNKNKFKKDLVGGVQDSSLRIFEIHKKLFNLKDYYFYKDKYKYKKKIIRLILDIKNMIRLTKKNQIIYCVCDNSSLIRTIVYQLYLRFFYKSNKLIVDIRGGGDFSRLNSKNVFYEKIFLRICYLLSDNIVLQTNNFESVNILFHKKLHFLPNFVRCKGT